MLTIIVFYYFQTRNKVGKFDKIMLIAFFFSLLGDIFLMLGDGNYFVMGLGSFLMTHFCYIYVFSQGKDKGNYLTRIAIIALSACVFFLIRNQIGSLLFPVVLYVLAISVMAICASERKTNPESYRFVFIGAILFVLSDSLIAIDKFAFKIPASTFLIMGTYVLAQYLIAIGFLKRNKA
jgi:uncharacterized membrane protein YhhN